MKVNKLFLPNYWINSKGVKKQVVDLTEDHLDKIIIYFSHFHIYDIFDIEQFSREKKEKVVREIMGLRNKQRGILKDLTEYRVLETDAIEEELQEEINEG